MADDKKAKEKKESKKVSLKVEKLVEEISSLSVIDLSQLVKVLQDKLGVTASMPVAAAPQAAALTGEAAQGAQAKAEGSVNQTLTITNSGINKIAVIKALREINQNLTLMDAKKMTEQVPAEVLKDAKAEDAKAAADKLKSAGATVELK